MLPLESGGDFSQLEPPPSPTLFTPVTQSPQPKKSRHSTNDNNSKTKQSDHLQTRYMQQSNNFPLGHSL